jgi:hypothetical protein
MLLGTNDLRREHAQMLRDQWVAYRDRRRELVKRNRLIVQQARDRGQSELASSSEIIARQAEADANLCDDMIEGAQRYLNRLDSKSGPRPMTRTKVLTMMLADLTTQRCTTRAPQIAAKLVEMATDTNASRFLPRRRPKDLPPHPPID